MSCLIPDDTDMLLNICIHGYRRGGGPPRWLGDSAVVLARARIDWTLLACEAENRQVALPLEVTLEFMEQLGFKTCMPPLRKLWWEPLDFCLRAGEVMITGGEEASGMTPLQVFGWTASRNGLSL